MTAHRRAPTRSAADISLQLSDADVVDLYDSLRSSKAKLLVLDVGCAAALQNPAPKTQALPRKALLAIYVPPAPPLPHKWWRS